MDRYICPCCGESLLVHVSGNKKVGFCLNCYQEMPLIAGHEIIENTVTHNPDYCSTELTDILLRNHQNINHIFQDSISGVWIIDREQNTLFANQKLADILGYTIEVIQTLHFWRFVDQHQPICKVLNSSQSLTQPEQYELKLLHKQGHWVWIKLSITPLIDEDNHCQGYLLKLLDLTHLKQIEHQLRQQTKREEALSHLLQVIRNSTSLATIFEAAVNGIGQVLPIESVKIVQYLPEQELWINQAEYHSNIQSFQPDYHLENSLISADSADAISASNLTIIEQEKRALPLKVSTVGPQTSALMIDSEQVEEFLQSCPGAWLPVPLYSQSSIWGCLSLVIQDPKYHWQKSDQTLIQSFANQLSIAISQAELYQQLEQARQNFQRLSTLDQLTQLPNRYYFNQNLSQTWEKISYHQQSLSLVLCHVDSFSYSQKNDGDRAANECLKQIAFVMRSSLKNPDQMVARYGQAEFALLLPNTESVEAVELIETLQTQIEQLQINQSTGSQPLIPTVSFGMASLIPKLGLSPQQLLVNAEQALDQGASQFCKCLLVQQ